MAELHLLTKTHGVLLDSDVESLRQRFMRGVSWNLVGTLLAQGSVFTANVVIANRLGPQVFGEFSLLQNTALTLAAIAQVATGVTATRYVAEYRASDPDRAGRIVGFCALFTLVTGLIAGMLLFALAGWLSAQTLNAPHLSDGLKIMAVYLVFSAISGYQNGALAGLEGYRRIACLGAVHAGIHIAVVLIGVWFYGLPGALWALVASLIMRWWLYHQAIRQEADKFGIRIAYVMQKDERSVLLRFSLPAALGGLTSMPALWLANTFLVQQPDGYRQLGFYSAALSLKAAVMLIPIAINSVGGSIISNQIRLYDHSQYRKAYWSNLLATVSISLLGAAVVIALGDFLLGLLGPEFVGAHGALVILMFATVPEALAIALYQIIQTRERMWWSLAAVNIPRDGLIVIAAYLLVKTSGASGIAIAYLLGWTVAFLVIAAKAYRIGIKPVNALNPA